VKIKIKVDRHVVNLVEKVKIKIKVDRHVVNLVEKVNDIKQCHRCKDLTLDGSGLATPTRTNWKG